MNRRKEDLEREVIRTSRRYFNSESATNMARWKRAIKTLIRAEHSEHARLESLVEGARQV